VVTGVADSFFTDEELDWWGDTEQAAAVALPVPRRRPPPRTLARDLERLRGGFERRSPVPASAAALATLVLTVALVAVVRLSLGGDDPVELTGAQPAAEAAPAPTPSASAGTRPPADPGALETGNRGPRVRDLQVALVALGLFAPAVDGSYGPATAAAVAAFQGASGLAVDGVTGPVTAAELQEALWEQARPDAATARRGIAAAAEAGRLDAAAAESANAAVAATLRAIRRQSPGRAAVLGLALRDVAAVADGYSAARTALFAELRANVEALAAGPPAIEASSVADGAGVVYRHFPDHGYQFHPLGSFAKLNTLLRRERREEAARLAGALAARGVKSGDTLLWQYRFPFGGPDVWTSGFAQATGAQALARAGSLLDDPELLEAAAASFRAIPRDLTLPVAGGEWIQEYSFSDMAVLNAQLQSIISLSEYATLSGNEEAASFAASLGETTKAVLGELDTGCWSLYSLGGNPATTDYHAYHVSLLERLGRRTGDSVWRDTGRRWRGYLDAGGC
jgi:peptidoglycan hydrolase-like protein with peptidoglycan-binding domain